MEAANAPASFHRLTHQLLLRFCKQRIGRLPLNGLSADLQHDRDGQRRDARESHVDDSTSDTREQQAQPADVKEAGGSLRPGGAQQDVIGLMATNGLYTNPCE